VWWRRRRRTRSESARLEIISQPRAALWVQRDVMACRIDFEAVFKRSDTPTLLVDRKVAAMKFSLQMRAIGELFKIVECPTS
jgi:hypothetical protein